MKRLLIYLIWIEILVCQDIINPDDGLRCMTPHILVDVQTTGSLHIELLELLIRTCFSIFLY